MHIKQLSNDDYHIVGTWQIITIIMMAQYCWEKRILLFF